MLPLRLPLRGFVRSLGAVSWWFSRTGAAAVGGSFVPGLPGMNCILQVFFRYSSVATVFIRRSRLGPTSTITPVVAQRCFVGYWSRTWSPVCNAGNGFAVVLKCFSRAPWPDELTSPTPRLGSAAPVRSSVDGLLRNPLPAFSTPFKQGMRLLSTGCSVRGSTLLQRLRCRMHPCASILQLFSSLTLPLPPRCRPTAAGTAMMCPCLHPNLTETS